MASPSVGGSGLAQRGTVEALREHRKHQTEERLAAGLLWNAEWNLVFATEMGTPLYPDTPTNLMAKLVRRAKLPHARTARPKTPPRDDTAARRPARARRRAGLGHADPAITLSVYAHVLREQAAGLADVFARVIDAS